MKVIITGYANKASIPFKKRKAICDITENFLQEQVESNLEYLHLIFDTMNEVEKTEIIGLKEDSYEVDFKYPNSKFSEMLISERIELFKKALAYAVVSFLEYSQIEVSKINKLNEKFNT